MGIYAVAKTKTRWSLNPYQTFCPGSKCALGHSRIIKLDRRHYTSHSVLGSIGVQSFVKQNFWVCRSSAIRSNSSGRPSVGSTHAAFWHVVIISRSDSIEVIVLESLLVLCTLHKLGNGVLDSV